MSTKTIHPFLELKNVTRTFSSSDGEISVLKNLSFSVQTGEVVAVIWPSGSWKTTLLNCIAGIDVPTSGAISILSDTTQTDITLLSDDERAAIRAKNIAFVFQDFLLLDHLTVEQNILLPIELHGITPRYSVDSILEKVGLLSKKNSSIGVLSRGERQRVAIARASIGEIPFLIADEPTGNLDTTNSQKIMDMMLWIAAEHMVTVLLVTHDPEIYKRAKRVIDISKLPKYA
jgi:putative ABC transport system ATP-binding protein